MFVHSADKLAEMRTKFHIIQAKLIMSVWCFTVQCHVILKDPNLALLAERIGGAIGSDAASYLKAVKTLNRLN